MTRAKVQRDEHFVDCDVHSENGIDVIPLPCDKAGTQIHIGDSVAVFDRAGECVAVCIVRGLTVEEMEPVCGKEENTIYQMGWQWRCFSDQNHTWLAKSSLRVFNKQDLAKLLADWETNAKESGTVNWHDFDGILNQINMTNRLRKEATGHWDDVE